MPCRRRSTSSSSPSPGLKVHGITRPSRIPARAGPNATRQGSGSWRAAEGFSPGVRACRIWGHWNEVPMDEERFNISLRRLLKQFGVTAQREVEKAVQASLASSALTGGEVLQARISMVVEGLPTDISVEG